MLSQIRMRQSAFTPAERMAERYNIELNVLDDLKQVYNYIFTICIGNYYDFFRTGFKVSTRRNGSINEYFERRFSRRASFRSCLKKLN